MAVDAREGGRAGVRKGGGGAAKGGQWAANARHGGSPGTKQPEITEIISAVACAANFSRSWELGQTRQNPLVQALFGE